MNEPIQNALSRLREETAGKQAPEHIEARLLKAYRAHHAARRRPWLWGAAAVAASIVVATVTWQAPEPAAVPKFGPQPIAAAVNQEQPIAKPINNARPRPKRKRAQQQTPVQQEFIEIPYAPAFNVQDGGRVVRVSMPGASVRSLGLPVMSERVQADVLFGNDGIARAIRLISTSEQQQHR
jgi:hypothetical protein